MGARRVQWAEEARARDEARAAAKRARAEARAAGAAGRAAALDWPGGLEAAERRGLRVRPGTPVPPVSEEVREERRARESARAAEIEALRAMQRDWILKESAGWVTEDTLAARVDAALLNPRPLFEPRRTPLPRGGGGGGAREGPRRESRRGPVRGAAPAGAKTPEPRGGRAEA